VIDYLTIHARYHRHYISYFLSKLSSIKQRRASEVEQKTIQKEKNRITILFE